MNFLLIYQILGQYFQVLFKYALPIMQLCNPDYENFSI